MSTTGPVVFGLSEGLGAASEALCWCHACRPITFADMRMVACPTCGDKRCLHALRHEAPCAKADIYAHNAWVERILLRSQRAPENSVPDEVAMTALGAGAEAGRLASEQRPRDGGPRFRVSDGGRTISDEDFIFDALIRVGGDFGDDALRTRYAQWMCDALNEADKQLPREPRAPNVQIDL